MLGSLDSRRGLGGGGVDGGLGQAEFTYLHAGSLPDFTVDIGGRYRERRVKGLVQIHFKPPVMSFGRSC